MFHPQDMMIILTKIKNNNVNPSTRLYNQMRSQIRTKLVCRDLSRRDCSVDLCHYLTVLLTWRSYDNIVINDNHHVRRYFQNRFRGRNDIILLLAHLWFERVGGISLAISRGHTVWLWTLAFPAFSKLEAKHS